MGEITRQALANKLNTSLAMIEALHRDYTAFMTTNEDRALLHITRKLHNVVANMVEQKEN